MNNIRKVAGGRKTVVYDLSGTIPGGVYFFADLTVGTSITEPSMSVWTEGDVTRWKLQIERSRVSCLVTTNTKAALVLNVLASFERYSVYEGRGPVPYTIYCRD